MGIKNGLKSACILCLISILMYSMYSIAIGMGSIFIVNKEKNSNTGTVLNGGDVLTVILSTLMAGFSLATILPHLKTIYEARVAASDLFELSKRVPQIDLSRSVKKPSKETITGKIEFKGVMFSYPNNPNEMILKNLSITFEPGKKTAIVGESGSGKSTIVNLLNRLYDITGGQILIDGIDIKEFDLPTLRSYIGYVQQEPILFNT